MFEKYAGLYLYKFCLRCCAFYKMPIFAALTADVISRLNCTALCKMEILDHFKFWHFNGWTELAFLVLQYQRKHPFLAYKSSSDFII